MAGNDPDWESVARLLAEALGAIDGCIADLRAADQRARTQAAIDALTAVNLIVEAVKRGDLDDLDLTSARERLSGIQAAILRSR